MAKPTSVKGLNSQTPVTEAAKLWMEARLADVRRHGEAVQREHDRDAIHDLRVASRRLRAALRLFDEGGALRGDERRVKHLQDALGSVRDTHVQLDRASGLKEGAGDKALLAGLREDLELELAHCSAELLPALERFLRHDLPRLEHRLPRLQPKGKLGGHRMREHLRQRLGQLEAWVEEAMPALDVAAAHRLRVATKRLRYELELLEPGLGAMADLLLWLTSLQDSLGELHDLDVQLDNLLMVRVMRRPGDMEAPSLLEHELLGAREEAAAKVRPGLEKLLRERGFKALRAALKHPEALAEPPGNPQ